jgi:hypothetical protein
MLFLEILMWLALAIFGGIMFGFLIFAIKAQDSEDMAYGIIITAIFGLIFWIFIASSYGFGVVFPNSNDDFKCLQFLQSPELKAAPEDKFQIYGKKYQFIVELSGNAVAIQTSDGTIAFKHARRNQCADYLRGRLKNGKEDQVYLELQREINERINRQIHRDSKNTEKTTETPISDQN